nr:ATP synthase F0 subunit 8 [Oncotympana maculaticollis]
MPQMSPMYWLILMMYFIMMMIMLMMMIFFLFKLTPEVKLVFSNKNMLNNWMW